MGDTLAQAGAGMAIAISTWTRWRSRKAATLTG